MHIIPAESLVTMEIMALPLHTPIIASIVFCLSGLLIRQCPPRNIRNDSFVDLADAQIYGKVAIHATTRP